MLENLSTRYKKVLQAVISEYILSSIPIGSRTITKKHLPELSPATVRNVMADLEEMGYLSQPHTSAGRIPTDKGFRFYVDILLELKTLSRDDKEEIENRFKYPFKDINEIMMDTSKVLSGMSHYIGVVVPPKLDTAIFKHIEFIKLRKHLILVIFVSGSGLIQNRLIDIEEDIHQEELDKMSKLLSDILKDLTLLEARNKIIEEMKQDRLLYNKLLSKALKMSQQVLNIDKETNIFIDGQRNILSEPGFAADIDKMKEIFKAFEEKSLLIRLLEKTIKAEGVKIYIGEESPFEEMKGYSIVVSSYGDKSSLQGTLGVIGPKRMDYSRIIPIVDYTAKKVSRLLEEEEIK